MTEQAPDRVWTSIDIPRTLAGALAAVCAAVIGSFLGVAGTLIGAAVASVIGSIGTEIWHRSLHKSAKKLQTTLAPAFVKAPAAVGTPEVAAATEEDSPSHTVPEEERKGKLRWRRIGLAAAVLFVLTMGTLTAVELLAGRSVASMVGGDSSGSTTLSSVTDGSSKSDDAPAPTVSETVTPGEDGSEPGVTPSTAPGDAPGATTPTDSPTTGDPATEAPTPQNTAANPGSELDSPGGAAGGSGGEAPPARAEEGE